MLTVLATFGRLGLFIALRVFLYRTAHEAARRAGPSATADSCENRPTTAFQLAFRVCGVANAERVGLGYRSRCVYSCIVADEQ